MTHHQSAVFYRKISGFTLIELSIVLVIIGLIVGGVLVGRDLIRSAAIRAQIGQIEKYQTAVNTFRVKYDALPGDMNNTIATGFGFTPRGTGAGQGDGDGIIKGMFSDAQSAGETVMFWNDLSAANGMNINLIEGSFSAATPNNPPATITPATTPAIKDFFPAAKIGTGNYVYVYSINGLSFANNLNYFVISTIDSITSAGVGFSSKTAIAVVDAYAMDSKIDDGLPQSGIVIARYLSGGSGTAQYWAAGNYTSGDDPGVATAGTAITCYNNTPSDIIQRYSLAQNGGAGLNCALSFKFQ